MLLMICFFFLAFMFILWQHTSFARSRIDNAIVMLGQTPLPLRRYIIYGRPNIIESILNFRLINPWVLWIFHIWNLPLSTIGFHGSKVNPQYPLIPITMGHKNWSLPKSELNHQMGLGTSHNGRDPAWTKDREFAETLDHIS